MEYDAFISYNHGADARLAEFVQRGLTRFAKPWHRLRAMRVFRDQTNLSLRPDLWSGIEEALSQSRYLVLFASPQAASSEWVGQEVSTWIRHHGSAGSVLLVCTRGQIHWDRTAGDFDWGRTTALPKALSGQYAEEPLHLDLCWAADEAHAQKHPRFVDAVADLAATIHGRAKDELYGEDVRQHRRARRLAISAVLALIVLTLAALISANAAKRNADLAETRRLAALSRMLAAEALSQRDTDLSRAVLLAVEAQRACETLESRSALLMTLEANEYSPTLRPAANPGDSQLRRRVFRAIFLPGGGRVVTCDFTGRMRLLDTTTRGEPTSVRAHDAIVTALALSPDGKFLASADAQGQVLVQALGEDGVLRVPLDPSSPKVAALAFDPRDARLLLGCNDGSVARFHPGDGQVETYLESGARDLTCLTAGSSGRYVAAGAHGGEVILWDKATGERLGTTLQTCPSPITTVAIDPLEKTVVAGTELGLLFTWRVGHPSSPGVPRIVHDGRVEGLAVSPDGRHIASVGQDRRLGVIDLEREAAPPVRLAAHQWPARAVAFGPDGRALVSIDLEGDVVAWSRRPTLVSGHGAPAALQFGDHASTLRSLAGDGTLAAWDCEQRQPAGQLPTTAAQTTSATIGHRFLVSTTPGASPDIELFDLLSGERVHSFTTGMDGSRDALALNAACDRLAVSRLVLRSGDEPSGSGLEGELRIFELLDAVPRGEAVRVVGRAFAVLAFLPDGRTLAAGALDGTVTLWDAESGSMVGEPMTGHDGWVLDVAVSADGRLLGACTADAGVVHVWDIHDPSRPHLLGTLEEANACAIAVRPDGRMMAIGTSDGRVALWDLPGLRRLGEPLTGHLGSVELLTFSADGQRLATAAEEDCIVLWDVSEGAWLERAPRIANRSLTREEWARYLPDEPYRLTFPGTLASPAASPNPDEADSRSSDPVQRPPSWFGFAAFPEARLLGLQFIVTVSGEDLHVAVYAAEADVEEVVGFYEREEPGPREESEWSAVTLRRGGRLLEVYAATSQFYPRSEEQPRPEEKTVIMVSDYRGQIPGFEEK